MYNSIIDEHDKCCGCTACVVACPKKCLTIEQDSLGFKYVKMTKKEDCINCGICVKVCQMQKEKKVDKKIFKANRYYAQNKNEDILKESSSGGVFSALAEKVLEQNGIVWGVAINEKGESYFLDITQKEELSKLRGSKYVEVSNEIPFLKIKEQLENQKLVLVSGLPCQIKALKIFLGEEEYENLILIDLLCYGIQSPIIWKKYLSEVNPNKLEIESIKMRLKRPSWENYAIKINYKNGTSYKRSRWKDPYLLTYATNLYNRQSCSNCTAKKFPRYSDLTLGDFWQIDALEQIPKEINVKKGVSVVISNTEKGDKFINEIKEKIFLYDIPDNVFTNMFERYSECSKVNSNKERFLYDNENKRFNKVVKSYTKNQIYARCRFIWLSVKRKIKSIKK